MKEQRHSTVSEKITAAAAVATAAAAAKTAIEATKVRKEMEANNRAAQIAAARQERIQLAMASEQEEHNFQNTVLTALRLLKNKEEKLQYLTDQILPILRDTANTEILCPLDYITSCNPLNEEDEDDLSPIEKYLDTEAARELPALIDEGKSLIRRQKNLEERDITLEQLQANRQWLVNNPVTGMGFIKICICVVLCFFILNGSFGIFKMLGLWQEPQNDLIRISASWIVAFIIGLFIHFLPRQRKLEQLKKEIDFSASTDNEAAATAERQALSKEAETHNQKWNAFKSKLIKHLIEKPENKLIVAGDARAFILDRLTKQIEQDVHDAQSFLPQSFRLPASHFAQLLIQEEDVKMFQDERCSIASKLETGIVPNYETKFGREVVVFKSTNKDEQNKVGMRYTCGDGVPQDCAEAVKWFCKAAEQNCVDAQCNLGACYTRGDGVAVDYVEAYKWRLLAAAQGDELAKKAVTALESLMTREQIAEGENRAQAGQGRDRVALRRGG